MPSTLRRVLILFSVLVTITIALVVSVSADAVRYDTATAVGAVIAALVTLTIGAGFIIGAPEYTDRATTMLFQRPGIVFLFGFTIYIFVVGNLLFLPVLLPDLVYFAVALPVLFGLGVLAEFGLFAVGRLVSESWLVILTVASVLSVVFMFFPIAAVFIGSVLSIMGIGATLLVYEDGSQADSEEADNQQHRKPMGSRRRKDGPDVEQ